MRALLAVSNEDNVRIPTLDDGPTATWRGNYDLFSDRGPKYHLYDLPDRMGFDQCDHSTSPDFKHNIDKLFIHKLIQEGKSVPPEKADVFVIPELLSQHAWSLCKNHGWRQQLREFLLASPWFQRYNGSDHLMIGDHYAWSKTGAINQLADIPGRVIVGHFEAYHPEARLEHR
jgi:hypothetical protein